MGGPAARFAILWPCVPPAPRKSFAGEGRDHRPLRASGYGSRAGRAWCVALHTGRRHNAGSHRRTHGMADQVGAPRDLVVHGTTSEGGHPLTSLDARVSSIALGNRVTALRATTLALGAHFDRETTWSCVTYTTAHLHEWLGDSGLRHDTAFDDRGQTQHLTYEWEPPPSYVVELDDARVTIGPAMDSQYGRIADWCVRTGTQLQRARPSPRPLPSSSAGSPDHSWDSRSSLRTGRTRSRWKP